MKRPTPQSDWPDSWRAAYHYDLAEIFGESGRTAIAYEQRMSRTLNLIRQVVASGARIIDIAAAQGNFSLRLAEAGYRVTWNDIRAELADYVRLKYVTGDIRFLPGDAFALAPGELYDAAVITEIIEHVAHPDAFLAQVQKLVRPGGHIIMTTPNGEYFANRLPKFSDCPDPSMFEGVQFQPDGDGHIFLLHREEVRALAEKADLDIVSMELFTSFFAAGRLRTKALLSATPNALTARFERFCASLPASLSARLFTQMAVCLKKPETPAVQAHRGFLSSAPASQ